MINTFRSNFYSKELKELKTKEYKTKYNSSDFRDKKIITFGTFDLFHIGHKKIIDHALEIAGNEKRLFIAVSSDKWNKLKGKSSYQNQNQRMAIVQKFYPNANVILEDHNTSEESWPIIWDEHEIDLIVMGGDHIENLSYINKQKTNKGKLMKIIFFERTPKISSTLIRNELLSNSTK